MSTLMTLMTSVGVMSMPHSRAFCLAQMAHDAASNAYIICYDQQLQMLGQWPSGCWVVVMYKAEFTSRVSAGDADSHASMSGCQV